LKSLNDGEKFLAQRGLLFEGDQAHLNRVKIVDKNGTSTEIPVETILIGENTLAIPSTSDAQEVFGASIPKQKRHY